MSIEQSPKFRIVGGASPEQKEEVKERIREVLFNHFKSLLPEEQKKLAKFEYRKSDQEKGLIDFANQETDELRREIGLEPYKIPYDNYHLLPSKIYKEMGMPGHPAAVRFAKQGIMVDAEAASSDPVILGACFIHETLHLKGHLSVEAEEKDGKARNSLFRFGVSAWGAQGSNPHGHFTGLNEAIVTTQEKKIFQKMLDSPLLKKEKILWTSSKSKDKREEMAKKEKIPENEIFWINNNGRERFGYFQARQVLDYICAEIQKEYPGQYKSEEEVFKEFLKSHFTGQLLNIARLVEKTFGKNGFRALGNMTPDDESAILHMELLRKARVGQLKKKKVVE